MEEQQVTGASLRDRAGVPSALSPEDGSQAKPLIPSALTLDEIGDDRDRLLLTLYDAMLQLQYLDTRFPTGTTPAIIARINAALNGALPWQSIAQAMSAGTAETLQGAQGDSPPARSATPRRPYSVAPYSPEPHP